MRSRIRSAVTPLAATGLAVLAACGRPGDQVEIAESRVATRASRRVLPGATAEERFTAHGRRAAEPREAVRGEPLFDYVVPEGWEELPPSEMRPANLRPAGDPDAECYLSYLAGDGGGLLANVNRWREQQMGLSPIGDEELAALPESTVLGARGVVVELEGSFRGMGAEDVRPGWKLVGLVVPGSSFSPEWPFTIFVKLTGPAALVDAERAAFEEFVASLALHAPEERPAPTAETAPAAGAAPFTFDLPDGWRAIAPSGMRDVNLVAGVDGEVECYVVRLPGEAGGLVPNVNRWRGEVGAGPLSAAEVVSLPTVPLLGQDCPIVEGRGDYEGMDRAGVRADAGLLGTLRVDRGGSVFVKMVGPAEAVAAERERFLAFVESLEER